MFDKKSGKDSEAAKRAEPDARRGKTVWLSVDEPALPEHVRRFLSERHLVKKTSIVPV
jgi:hypothetical protein